MTRWDSDPLVEVPDGGPARTPYLASGWSDGVGRFEWGATPTHAAGIWRRRWGRDAGDRGETRDMTINWPTVATIATGIIAALVLLFVGRYHLSPDTYAYVSTPILGFFVVLVGFMKKAIERAESVDTDGDGTPDWRDPSPRGQS